MSLSIRILNSQCAEGARDVRVLKLIPVSTVVSFSDWLKDFKRHLACHNLKTSRSEIRIFDFRKFRKYYEANFKDAKNQIHLHFDGPNGEDRSIRQVFVVSGPHGLGDTATHLKTVKVLDTMTHSPPVILQFKTY